MAGLILKLRPNEELLINGVVIQNGDRKTQLRVKTDGASILRLKDAMRPEEATTPERRAYYVAQLAVAGEIADRDARDALESALVELAAAHMSGPEAAHIAEARAELGLGRFYGVMRRLGALIRTEPGHAPETKAVG
jgi:flagellar protein FlbT